MSGWLVLVLPGGEREALKGVDFGWHLKRLHEHIASAHPEGQHWSANLLRLATATAELDLAAGEEDHPAGRIQDRLPGDRRFDERSLTERGLQDGNEVWVRFAEPSDPTTVLDQIGKCGSGIHWGWACGSCPITSIAWHESDLKRNKEVVMAAMHKNGGIFRFTDLKGDYDVVLEAVKHDSSSLEVAMEALKSNREIVIAAGSLKHASEQLRADPDIVSAIVNHNPNELQYASDELRADWSLVAAAVQTSGMTLQYASDELRADRSLVAAAVQTSGMSLQHASIALRADRAIVMSALQTHYMTPRYGGPHGSRYGNPFYYASSELKSDPSVAIQALSSEFHGHLVYQHLVDRALDNLYTTQLDLPIGCLWRLEAVRTVLRGTHDPASPLHQLRRQCNLLEQILMHLPQAALEALLVAPALRQAVGDARADEYAQSYADMFEPEAADTTEDQGLGLWTYDDY